LAASWLTVRPRGCALAVLVGGFEKAASRATEEIAGLCAEMGRAEVRADDEEARRLWEAIRSLLDASDPSRPLLKIAVPPSRSLDAFDRLRSELEGRRLPATLLAHAANGLVYARLEPRAWSDTDIEALASLISQARSFAVERQGSLVVESAPVALKQRVDVWGEIGPALKLMRSLKEKLDPHGTLNPGRFVGRI
jgi:FAD/FMN-containing dehydrogenase